MVVKRYLNCERVKTNSIIEAVRMIKVKILTENFACFVTRGSPGLTEGQVGGFPFGQGKHLSLRPAAGEPKNEARKNARLTFSPGCPPQGTQR